MRPFPLSHAVAAFVLSFTLVPLPALAHHGNPAEHEAEVQTSGGAGSETYSLGDMSVDDPWSRATPPTANVGAGYLTLRNKGDAPNRLLGGSSPVAQRVEIHTMEIVDDVMRMRQLPDGVAVPAGGEVSLAPGGHHFMLIGLNQPLAEGDRIPLTLEFESGSIDIELAVQGMGASSAPEAHGGH